MLRSLVLLGAGIALLWIVWPTRDSRQTGPLTEVPRAALALQEGRLYQTGQTNAFTGWMVEFYEDGLLKSRSMISNGLLHGVSQGWHTNGQLQVREEFRNGVSHGQRTKWYANGTKLSEAAIVDGKLHGMFRRWHENGAVAEEIEMENGNAEGVSWAFYASGFLKAQARMQQGEVVERMAWPDGEARRDATGTEILN